MASTCIQLDNFVITSWTLVLVSLMSVCSAFSQGSAIVNAFESSYCESRLDDMQRGPLHYDMVSCGGVCSAGIAPRNMYVVRANSSEYSVDNITVHLRANGRNGANILGFVIVAISESGRTAGNWIADESENPEVLRATCDSTLEGQVIFHARPSSARTSVEVVWDPTRTNYGRIIFRAWVVQRHDVIFTVDSQPLENLLNGGDFISIENRFSSIMGTLLRRNSTRISNSTIQQNQRTLSSRMATTKNRMVFNSPTPSTTTTTIKPPTEPSPQKPVSVFESSPNKPSHARPTPPQSPDIRRLQTTSSQGPRGNRRQGTIFRSVRNRLLLSQNRRNRQSNGNRNNTRSLPDSPTTRPITRSRPNLNVSDPANNNTLGKRDDSALLAIPNNTSLITSSASLVPSSSSESPASSLSPPMAPSNPSPTLSFLSQMPSTSPSPPPPPTPASINNSRQNITDDSLSTPENRDNTTSTSKETSVSSSSIRRAFLEQFEDSFRSRLTMGFNLSQQDPFRDFNKDTYSLADFFPSPTENLPNLLRAVAERSNQIESRINENPPRNLPPSSESGEDLRLPSVRRVISNEPSRPLAQAGSQTMPNSPQMDFFPNNQWNSNPTNNRFQTGFQGQMPWSNQNINNLPWMTPVMNFGTSRPFQSPASSSQFWSFGNGNGNQQFTPMSNGQQRQTNPQMFSNNPGQFPNINQMLGRSVPSNNNNFQMANGNVNSNNRFIQNPPFGSSNQFSNNGNNNMDLQNQIRIFLANRNTNQNQAIRSPINSQRQFNMGNTARGLNRNNGNDMSFNWFG